MDIPSDKATMPFLRWLGGKRWLSPSLAPSLRRRLAASGGTYFEPFLGSGAMALAVEPENAVLSDVNAGLINCFAQVQRHPAGVLEAVARWTVDKRTYDAVREGDQTTGIEGAARFLYLNRTCYGGLHRENRKGRFNAAYGGGSRTTAPLWDERLVERASAMLLRGAIDVRVQRFAASIEAARCGDVVYCDPPYTDGSRVAFDRYGAQVFSWKDQVSLAEAAAEACMRGVLVLVSNAGGSAIADLYPGAATLRFWKRKRVGNRALDDGTHDEMIFILDPEEDPAWLSLQKRAGEPYGPRKTSAARPDDRSGTAQGGTIAA